MFVFINRCSNFVATFYPSPVASHFRSVLFYSKFGEEMIHVYIFFFKHISIFYATYLRELQKMFQIPLKTHHSCWPFCSRIDCFSQSFLTKSILNKGVVTSIDLVRVMLSRMMTVVPIYIIVSYQIILCHLQNFLGRQYILVI